MNENTIDRTRETVLILRTCKHDMTGYNGFQWPETGYVAAPDWEPTAECGNGLHGWLKGAGDTSLGYLDTEGYKALVVETYADHIIELGGKVKFPFGWVAFAGDLVTAAALIQDRYPDTAVIGGTATAGDGGTATAGDRGTATAGDRGTATAGDGGTATAGYRGTATAGNGGTATAGYRGTATAGDRGTATAGNGGTATAGYRGTATAGDFGTATAGNGGTATAGNGGMLIIQRWNGKRYKFEVAKVGDDGLKPNVLYRLNDEGLFVEVGNG